MDIKKLFIAGIKCFLAFGVFIIFFSSCVPNRKITYLQYKDELSQVKSIPTDSVMRVYETSAYQYRLQPDDQIDIRISTTTPDEFNPYSLADRYLTTGGTGSVAIGQTSGYGYRIDPQGYLNLPVIGRLKAIGMSIFELQDTIDVLAVKDLENPVTKINLLNFRYTIIGEVNGTGSKVTSDYTLSLLQAMAGGPAEYADLSRIKIIRKVNNESSVAYVNLLDEAFLSSEYYYVHPNDVIIVSPMKRRLLIKNVPQTLGFVASALSLVLTIFTLIAVNK
jgi:polysaccharide export outer membrane protein